LTHSYIAAVLPFNRCGSDADICEKPWDRFAPRPVRRASLS
jgi:hypothetical protein